MNNETRNYTGRRAKCGVCFAPQGDPYPRRAFTLVEAMVTIGIIVFLAGLTFTAATSIKRKMEVRQTSLTLDLLDLAVAEWNATAGRSLSWRENLDDNENLNGVAVASAEVNWNTPEVFLISEVLDAVGRDPAAKRILSQIDSDLMYVYVAGEQPPWVRTPQENEALNERFIGSLTVLDAWGNPIYATHPGRIHDSKNFWYDRIRELDRDGTIRTYNESKYGIASHRRMCFVSAGPDGVFGFLGSLAESADFKATVDNVYSYPPLRP